MKNGSDLWAVSGQSIFFKNQKFPKRVEMKSSFASRLLILVYFLVTYIWHMFNNLSQISLQISLIISNLISRLRIC